MKHTFILSVGLGTTFLMILCAALYFQQDQKIDFEHSKEKYESFQRELMVLEDDLAFLKQHEKELTFLIKAGWFIPHNRLIGSEIIHELAQSLNGIRFTFEPETIKEAESGYTYKVSRMTIEVDSLLDTDIYDFFANVLKKFPGILIVRKFSIHKREKVNKRNLFALRQQKHPNFVVGEMTYEWFAVEGKKHEE